MSEYQYYEFRGIDRSLTAKQQEVLRKSSSRATITARSFTNEYSYGSFRGDEDRWMAQYFDAFLYVANWGTRTVKFHFPKGILDAKSIAQYSAPDGLTFQKDADGVVATWQADGEGKGMWLDGEGMIQPILPVRALIIQGDRRALYLGWLLGAQAGELAGDALEPEVPPGLGKLNKALNELADLLYLDPSLIQTAVTVPRDGHRRTAQELLDTWENGRDEWEAAVAKKEAAAEARRQRAAAVARTKELDALVGQEPALWQEVERLTAIQRAEPYDRAVKLLIDLRGLAARGDSPDFVNRLAAFHEAHPNQGALRQRMKKVGL